MTLTAAMRTQRVRICSNIIQLPLYHPVLLAEQLAARRGSKRAIVAVGHTILTIS